MWHGHRSAAAGVRGRRDGPTRRSTMQGGQPWVHARGRRARGAGERALVTHRRESERGHRSSAGSMEKRPCPLGDLSAEAVWVVCVRAETELGQMGSTAAISRIAGAPGAPAGN